MSDDWRDKYLKLADEHEREEARHGEAERELTRLVTRLCVAVTGLDATLDPHLERLRKAAKGGNSATLLRNADHVMYLAKQRGRNGYQFFDPDTNSISNKRKDWAARAAQALQRRRRHR